MTVSTSIIAGLFSPQQLGLQKSNSTLQSAIASLVSGNSLTHASDDVSSLSIAVGLQTQLSGLRQASSNINEASSLAQVADGGAEQIQGILQRLQTLAEQAQSPTITDVQRKDLNTEFKQLANQIDNFADNTTFGGKKLLDGSLTGSKAISVGSLVTGVQTASEKGDLSISSLYSSSLFGGVVTDISTVDGAKQAVSVLANALDNVTSVRATIGAFEQSINYISANIETAASNQEAARANLTDTDFTKAGTGFSLDKLQYNTQLALAAQGNKLPASLLQLVG